MKGLIGCIFINKDRLAINIFNQKGECLFYKDQSVRCFNEFLAVVDVKTFKNIVVLLITEAEKALEQILLDFILILDGCKIECREAEITRQFRRPRKITRVDIETFEKKAKEVVFDADISTFVMRPSKILFENEEVHYSIPFENSFLQMQMFLMLLGFNATTFTNLTNILSECKINIIGAANSSVLAASEYISSSTNEEEERMVFINLEYNCSSILVVKEASFVYYTNIDIGFDDLITKIAEKLEVKHVDALKILKQNFLQGSQPQPKVDALEELDNQTIFELSTIVNQHHNAIISACINKYIEAQNKHNILSETSKEFFDVILCGTYNSYITPLNLTKLDNATISIKNYLYNFTALPNEQPENNKNKLCDPMFLVMWHKSLQTSLASKTYQFIKKLFE